MKSLVKKICLIVMVVASVGIVIGVQSTIGDVLISDLGQDYDLYYVGNSNYIKIISAGFESIVADVYWIKSILYFGRRSIITDYPMVGKQLADDGTDTPEFALWKKEVKQRYRYLPGLINMVVELEPNFQAPYLFGGLMISMKAGEVDKSIALLNKAKRSIPENWQVPYLLGFNYYFYKDESNKALGYFMDAAKVPGCPQGVTNLSVAILQKEGKIDVAREFLGNLKNKSRDEGTIQELDRLLEVLKDSEHNQDV